MTQPARPPTPIAELSLWKSSTVILNIIAGANLLGALIAQVPQELIPKRAQPWFLCIAGICTVIGNLRDRFALKQAAQETQAVAATTAQVVAAQTAAVVAAESTGDK